jgi:hypothetical protein
MLHCSFTEALHLPSSNLKVIAILNEDQSRFSSFHANNEIVS